MLQVQVTKCDFDHPIKIYSIDLVKYAHMLKNLLSFHDRSI